MRILMFIIGLIPALPAGADPAALAPDAALACAAGRYRGEALRIRDKKDGRVQELRWLTPAGNVLEIELSGPGCRFIEVKGVGQTEARILPAPRPAEAP